MASLSIGTTPYSDIDYSLVDGRIRALVIRGEKLYDEQTGLEAEGWRDKLVEFVKEQQLHRGAMVRAFVHRMRADGLLISQEEPHNPEQNG